MLAETAQPAATQEILIGGCKTELWTGGAGQQQILLLHPGDGFDPDAPFVASLAQKYRILAASHPGFGGSDLPKNMSTPDDLAYFYLDLLEHFDSRDVIVLGISFGAWVAAELAVKGSDRIAGLILADALGVKFEGPKTREIADPFSIAQYDLDGLYFHDAKRWQRDYAACSEETLLRLARNHESFSIFGWSPTLHNPKLRQRLHRIQVPTQLIWGEFDRVVPVEYGRKYAAEIKGATFTVIEGAGHYPQIEQSERFVSAVDSFIERLPNVAGRAPRQSVRG